MRKLSSSVVTACLLLAAAGGHAVGGANGVTAASLQGGAPESTLLPVALPDLGRAHTSVQAQLREAYEALTAASLQGGAPESTLLPVACPTSAALTPRSRRSFARRTRR